LKSLDRRFVEEGDIKAIIKSYVRDIRLVDKKYIRNKVKPKLDSGRTKGKDLKSSSSSSSAGSLIGRVIDSFRA
jgi:hypothetical protein